MSESFMNELKTPGWQYFKRAIVFLGMVILLGTMFQVLMKNNPEEWRLPKDDDGNVLINGFYYGSNLLTFTGYGDFTPHSQRAIIIVMMFLLVWWGTITVMFPTF